MPSRSSRGCGRHAVHWVPVIILYLYIRRARQTIVRLDRSVNVTRCWAGVVGDSLGLKDVLRPTIMVFNLPLNHEAAGLSLRIVVLPHATRLREPTEIIYMRLLSSAISGFR